MSEVCWLTNNFGYIEGPTTVGVIRLDKNRAFLIDSGLNKDSARKIDRAIKKEGLVVNRLFNTHSHADHYGGNDYFLSRYRVEVLAPAGEAGVMNYPIWEPFYLFGGVPPEELKVGFLYPSPSRVDRPVKAGPLEIEGSSLNLIDLSGHSLFQLGVEFEECAFLADAVFSPEVWEKHFLVYFADLEAAENTLKKLLNRDLKGVVISHSGKLENPRKVIEENLRRIEETGREILELLREGSFSADEILALLAQKYNKSLDNLPSYYLARQTILSYLVWAKNRGLVALEIKNNAVLWKVKVLEG